MAANHNLSMKGFILSNSSAFYASLTQETRLEIDPIGGLCNPFRRTDAARGRLEVDLSNDRVGNVAINGICDVI